ncbi:MAG: hypothetical protein MI725_17520 [Pirellulales bacterium]|nr:hypothetical protein [Pirellulales bacterium]
MSIHSEMNKESDISSGTHESRGKQPLAVVSCLPPDDSGVAIFTLATLAGTFLPLHFFSTAEAGERASANCTVRPDSALVRASTENNYAAAIYVVGNSLHNAAAIRFALDSPIEPFLILLHDPCLNDVVRQLIRSDKGCFCTTGFQYWWWRYSGRKLFRHRPTDGLSFWLSQMKASPKGWIVHSSRARELVSRTIRRPAPIKQLFHPIFDAAPPRAAPKVTEPWVIGHFGMIGEAKRIGDLIDVCRRLRENGRAVRLLLAGYNSRTVSSYLSSGEDFVDCHEPESTTELLSLMRSVDLAVQLRVSDLGEVSGVVSQLMGQRCQVLASEGSISEQYRDLLHTIPANADFETLYGTIMELLERPSDKVGGADLADFSTAKYQDQFASFLEELGILNR